MTFSPSEEQRLEAAIAEAEMMTSGEIRLHIEDHCHEDPLNHARKAFERLEMHKTVDRNAVLLYVALMDHKLAIYGDHGINSTVGINYWASIVDLITDHARKGDLVSGLEKGILNLGNILKKYYPYRDGDVNELENTITYHRRG
jgi:uncharacterized membrane protein